MEDWSENCLVDCLAGVDADPCFLWCLSYFLARHLYSGLLGRKLHPGSPILLLSLPRGIKAAYSLRSSVSIMPANMVSGVGLLIGALFPVESFTAEVRENISSAVILMRPSFSQSDPESRAGFFIMISLESTWNVRVSNVLSL